jgi:hypothetical protein
MPVPSAAAPVPVASPFPSSAAPEPPAGLAPEQIEALELQYEDVAIMRGNRDRDPRNYFELVFKFSGPAFKVFEAAAAKEDRRVKATEQLMRSTVVAGFWRGEVVTDEAGAKRLIGKVLDRLPRIPHSDNAQEILKFLYGDVAPSLEKV